MKTKMTAEMKAAATAARAAEYAAKDAAMVASGELVKGAAQFAHGGKLHSAIMLKGSLMFCCSCASTRNGRANHTAVFYAGIAPTCRI